MAPLRCLHDGYSGSDRADPAGGAQRGGWPAGVLRKCVALGAQTASNDLVEWATRELRGYFSEGYGPEPDLPGYRIVAAPLVIDGMDGGVRFTRLQISPVELPEPARDKVKEEVELRAGVGELEDLLRRAREDGDDIRFGLPARLWWELCALRRHDPLPRRPGVRVRAEPGEPPHQPLR